MTQSADTGELPALRTARRAGLIEQVIDQLREQIVAGTWAIGARIPTEAELAQLTGTSRNTVREAVQSLVHAGLLERRQGSGTYVLAASEFAGAVSRRIATAHRLHVRHQGWVGLHRDAAATKPRDNLSRKLPLVRPQVHNDRRCGQGRRHERVSTHCQHLQQALLHADSLRAQGPLLNARRRRHPRGYSHSMVAGGLLEMSYTTRLTPRTSLMIRLLIRASTS